MSADSATTSCSSDRVVVDVSSGLLRRSLETIPRGVEPLLHCHDVNHVSESGDEMPSSREDLELCTDKVLSKGRILQELTKAVKLVSDRETPLEGSRPSV